MSHVGGDASSSLQFAPEKNVLPRECGSQPSCAVLKDFMNGEDSRKIFGNGALNFRIIVSLLLII